jgi:hypothetical protein
MSSFIKKIKSLLPGLLIIAILVPASVLLTPKKAEAQVLGTGAVSTIASDIGAGISAVFNGATSVATQLNTSLKLKDLAKEVGKQVLMATAKKLLAEMTKSTVNWINTGFHGRPLFVENPGSFFQDIAKSEIKDFINTIGYDKLRFPFGKEFALQIISSYKTQLADNASYSLSKAISDPVLLHNYQTNFNYGGWNGFLLNTQYPQNNPIGFQLVASDQIAARLQGTIDSKAQTVKNTLQQGLGFLSPQTCPSNLSYDNNSPDFDKPPFSVTTPYDPPSPIYDEGNEYGRPSNQDEIDQYDVDYNQQKAAEQADWAKKNVCPGGLKNTTPGSLVGTQIGTALGSTIHSTELGAAMGTSISAITDALLNHFLDKGLNALASKINPAPAPDNFSYNGVTLGTPNNNVNGQTDVFNLPDEEVDLAKFKNEVEGSTVNGKYTPGAIDLTSQEILLIDNLTTTTPGVLQVLNQVWQKTKELDYCQPGPKFGWEAKLEDEKNTILTSGSGLGKELGSNDELKVRAAKSAQNDLKFAVSSFKDWVINKKQFALPSSIEYIDSISDLKNQSQKLSELTSRKQKLVVALARLNTIDKNLKTLVEPADTASAATKASFESKIITLRKQYKAIQDDFSNTGSVEDMRSNLNSAIDSLSSLKDLVGRCQVERKAAGWSDVVDPTTGIIDFRKSFLAPEKGKDHSIPGDVTAPQGGSNVTRQTKSITADGTDEEMFCSLPIQSGYSHGDIVRRQQSNNQGADGFAFKNPVNDKGSTGYEDLPLVNAAAVYGDHTGSFNLVDVNISCDELYRVSDQDYKHAGDLLY